MHKRNMKKEWTRVGYWAQLLLLPFYGFSFLFPRDRKIWLFGSTFGRRFADNPRYFYLYLSQYKKEIKTIWISENEKIVRLLRRAGYRSYRKKSILGTWYCLRGGVYFYDNYPKDISHWLSAGAIKINLWHGVPLKKIQRDNVFDTIRHPRNKRQYLMGIPRRLSDEKPQHYILATSNYFRPIFSSAFGTDKVIVNGYPRTDIFTFSNIKNVLSEEENASLDEILQKTHQHKKIILYMPTFRESELQFFSIIELNKLNYFLEQYGYVLCVKLHCKSKLKETFDKLQSPNIVVIDPNTDPYVYISISDALITDYSSIYFDYLLTDKPILFFCYDLEQYLQNAREMYFPYNEFTPGPKVRTQEDLQEALKDIFCEETDKEERDRVKQTAFMSQARTASEELYLQIMNLVQ